MWVEGGGKYDLFSVHKYSYSTRRVFLIYNTSMVLYIVLTMTPEKHELPRTQMTLLIWFMDRRTIEIFNETKTVVI
jgi:hypothetical protein